MNWSEYLQRTLSGEFIQVMHLDQVLINLALAIFLGQVLAWHYRRYAQVLSNKTKFARMFVFITGTTFLIISVVKSSLALSLGLVGALSIIRFRTPVKEPEELAYLFLAIAVGVGLAAAGGDTATAWVPTTVTVIVFTVTLTYISLRSAGSAGVPQRSVLQVTAPLVDAGPGHTDGGAAQLKQLLPAVEAHCRKVDLRRVDCGSGEFHASLLVELGGANQIAELLAGIRAAVTGASVSVIEWEGLE